MKLYRFSPIQDEATLLKAIQHLHASCLDLCKQAVGYYLPIAGNIGIFCHYEDEFAYLQHVRRSWTLETGDPNQKYYPLIKPIIIEASQDYPSATYTHLYIRKPDPYRHHVGDVDFYLPDTDYRALKSRLLAGETLNDARIFPRQDLDMIELYHPDNDTLGYINALSECKYMHVHKTPAN